MVEVPSRLIIRNEKARHIELAFAENKIFVKNWKRDEIISSPVQIFRFGSPKPGDLFIELSNARQIEFTAEFVASLVGMSATFDQRDPTLRGIITLENDNEGLLIPRSGLSFASAPDDAAFVEVHVLPMTEQYQGMNLRVEVRTKLTNVKSFLLKGVSYPLMTRDDLPVSGFKEMVAIIGF